MRTFLRCVWANKFAFVGYVLVALGGGGTCYLTDTYSAVSFLLMTPGLFLLAITVGGLETLAGCERAYQAFEKRGGVLGLGYFRLWGRGRFCFEVGHQVAKERWEREHDSPHM